MKFGRYLEDTQIPEWKKAYIDYRGLKKLISAIKESQQAGQLENARVDFVLPVSVTDPFSVIDIGLTHEWRDTLPLQSSGAASPRLSYAHRKTSSVADRDLGEGKPDLRRRSNRHSLMARVQTLGHLAQMTPPVTLTELLPTLNWQHKRFIDKLDSELEKIDSFYSDREKEAKARLCALKQRLCDLEDSRRLQATPNYIDQPQWQSLSFPSLKVNSKMLLWLSNEKDDTSQPGFGPSATVYERERLKLNPDEYQRSRKKLKAAVVEFYRNLEVLNNFRTLNVIGFGKALKKFEKVTLITVQNAYTREKIDLRDFASSEAVKEMIKETEVLFTSKFARGDRKKALASLCAGGTLQKSHYCATYRTGFMLGLAVAATASGLYYSFDAETRNDIPGWGGLLLIYSILLIPVLLALGVGANIIVWNRARINYVFIFELDVKTKLDYQEYFEIPAILFSTFSFAFWLSFSRIGAASVAPTTWPLIWLAFYAIFTLNPFPIYHRSSRSWMYRSFGRLLLPGIRRVKFSDFWLADQFCSLVYPLVNLYAFGCIYASGFDASWQNCTGAHVHMAIPIVLAMLPFLVRIMQCIKCWVDSRVSTHIINAGKYASGITMQACYYNWWCQGRPRDASFFFYCLSATWYSTYACAWDLLVDWSVLRVGGKYPLLREELLGSDYFPLYYFAIVTNIVIRFLWILYIPVHGPNLMVRSFIVGFLEMLRRWQWNFYRLESEHLGNVDQYRATREVPLPQPRDESSQGFYDGEPTVPPSLYSLHKPLGRTRSDITV